MLRRNHRNDKKMYKFSRQLPFNIILGVYLRAILQESEAKLEMKNFNPSSIFVCREVTLGDIQKQPYLDRQMYRCHGNRTI